jgi:hypothetical protein
VIRITQWATMRIQVELSACQNLHKRGIVVKMAKQRESIDSAVQHMIGKVSGDLYGLRLPKH